MHSYVSVRMNLNLILFALEKGISMLTKASTFFIPPALIPPASQAPMTGWSVCVKTVMAAQTPAPATCASSLWFVALRPEAASSCSSTNSAERDASQTYTSAAAPSTSAMATSPSPKNQVRPWLSLNILF